MTKKTLAAIAIILSLLAVGHLYGRTAQAQVNSLVDTADAKYKTGDYGLDDFLALAIRISRWILGIVGSLSLVMFIYGGFTFLISAGSADKVGEAKKIILAAVIGLIIVFSSFLIIRFVLGTLGLNWDGSQAIPKATALLVR